MRMELIRMEKRDSNDYKIIALHRYNLVERIIVPSRMRRVEYVGNPGCWFEKLNMKYIGNPFRNARLNKWVEEGE